MEGNGTGVVARKDLPCKIEADILQKAKLVVAKRKWHQPKLTIAAYLSSILRGPVEKDYAKEFESEKGAKGGGK